MFIKFSDWHTDSAQKFIADADRLTNAVFVGESIVGKLITVGRDLINLTLPFSGLHLGGASATRQLTNSLDTRL